MKVRQKLTIVTTKEKVDRLIQVNVKSPD